MKSDLLEQNNLEEFDDLPSEGYFEDYDHTVEELDNFLKDGENTNYRTLKPVKLGNFEDTWIKEKDYNLGCFMYVIQDNDNFYKVTRKFGKSIFLYLRDNESTKKYLEYKYIIINKKLFKFINLNEELGHLLSAYVIRKSSQSNKEGISEIISYIYINDLPVCYLDKTGIEKGETTSTKHTFVFCSQKLTEFKIFNVDVDIVHTFEKDKIENQKKIQRFFEEDIYFEKIESSYNYLLNIMKCQKEIYKNYLKYIDTLDMTNKNSFLTLDYIGQLTFWYLEELCHYKMLAVTNAMENEDYLIFPNNFVNRTMSPYYFRLKLKNDEIYASLMSEENDFQKNNLYINIFSLCPDYNSDFTKYFYKRYMDDINNKINKYTCLPFNIYFLRDDTYEIPLVRCAPKDYKKWKKSLKDQNSIFILKDYIPDEIEKLKNYSQLDLSNGKTLKMIFNSFNDYINDNINYGEMYNLDSIKNAVSAGMLDAFQNQENAIIRSGLTNYNDFVINARKEYKEENMIIEEEEEESKEEKKDEEEKKEEEESLIGKKRERNDEYYLDDKFLEDILNKKKTMEKEDARNIDRYYKMYTSKNEDEKRFGYIGLKFFNTK